jgi:transposase
MARAYSYDLRVKVMKFLEKGTIKEASKVFSISRKTIIEWKKLKKNTGDVKAKEGYQTGHRSAIKDKDVEKFKKFIEENNGKSIKELAKAWEKPISASAIFRSLHKLGYTHKKKTFYHPKRDINMRKEFIEKTKLIPQEKLVWLDESGIEDNACIEYGWSICGIRCFGEKIHRHKSRVSMIAGLCNKQIIAPLIFEGNCNKEVFETYVETTLIKALRPGQIVIMDNINFHKTSKVKELIESVGCTILFLPTYSPDLNKIEHYWFKIKNEIRKSVNKIQTFFDVVYYSLQKVTILSN